MNAALIEQQFKDYVHAVSDMLVELRLAQHSGDTHRIEVAIMKIYTHNCAMRETLGLGPYVHGLKAG